MAGGIPIIKAIREGLAGNRIEWLAGIINGTGNFILTEMREKGRDFGDVLEEAQQLGYAEADPTFDVEGIDASHKLAILASLAFGIPLQLKKVYTGKYEDLKTLGAGDIGVICGFSKAQVGDVLGSAHNIPDSYSFSAPLLTVKVSPENDSDFAHLTRALRELAAEDPMLGLEFLAQQRQLHLKITGWIQIEVLESVLKDRFDLAATFSSPTIIYKEMPSQTGFGFERYWMLKPCRAILKLLIEPLPVGSGVQYVSQLGVNDVALKYQNEVERTIPEALRQGPKGWEVTDLKITLVEGEEHPVHSRPGDFIIATPMALMNGLVEADTTLLEPILAFRISAARDLLGSITSDLSRMRATFGSPEILGERFVRRRRKQFVD